jgi:dual specificity protein kinase YAK1
MMEMGKQTNQFFDSFVDVYGRKKWRLKSLEQYSREHNTNEQPGKQYFKATTLPEIVNTAPMPQFKSGRHSAEMEKGHYSSSFESCRRTNMLISILQN